jgi:CPA1 family monovalent cation:H+ antiporter
MIDAAVSHLNDAKEKDSEEAAAVYEDLARHYHQRLASLQSGDGNPGPAAGHDRHLELSLEAMRVERQTVVHLRDEGRINDDVLRRIERELDLSESRIASVREK